MFDDWNIIIIRWNYICLTKNQKGLSGIGMKRGREDNRVCCSSADYSTKYERRSVDARGKHGYFRWCIAQRIAILILEYRSARGLVFAKSGCNRGDRGISKRAKFKLAAISWRFSLPFSPPHIHAPCSHECTRSFFSVRVCTRGWGCHLKCQIRDRNNTGVFFFRN